MSGDEALVDATGLLCPLPVLRARKALQRLPPAAHLRLLATDPGAVRDVAAFCRENGHDLVAQNEVAGRFTFLIRKRVQ